MRITRLRITDFKRHKRLEIEPAPGLTIIRGPNESGKSTIAQALELVLFRKADSNSRDVRQAWAWGSEEPPMVSLELEADGEPIRLAKRFGGPRAEAALELAGGSTNDHSLIGQRIAELTGIPTEGFFRATASVGHTQLGHVGADEPLLGDRLQEVISGSDRGTGKARKKLEAAIHRYRTEGQKNPGLLKVARAEIDSLGLELAEGEAALGRLEADRAQLVDATERSRALELQLGRQQADLAEAARAEALATQRDTAQERYERTKRAAELVAVVETLQARSQTTMPLGELRASVGRAASLELEISELEADLDVEVAALSPDEGPAPPVPWPLHWFGLAALLLLIAIGALLVLGGILGLIAAVALAAGAVLALALALRPALGRRQRELARQLAERAAAERHEADRERHERFRRKRRELDATLASIGVADVATAEAILAATEADTEQLLAIEGELRGLGVDERSVQRLERARDLAANETEQARHALAGMGALAQDPAVARLAAQRLVEQTLPARDKARSEADQAQGRVDANAVDAELVAGLAERLSSAREWAVELERRVAIYEGTLRAIELAEQATMKTAARYLEERMGPVIAQITDGRYDEIEVDEKNLRFQVRAPETGELVDVEQLSQGTADQLFLAARLGLVHLVTMDRRPPLILDDPFVTFDGPRAERSLRLVKQYAADQGVQVLYLTSSNRFDALADGLVVLDGPSSERVLANPVQRAAARQAAPEPLWPEQAAPTSGAAAFKALATKAVANAGATVPAGTAAPTAPRTMAPARPTEVPAPATEEPAPTLRFEPDPRPNPDPVAPRKNLPDDALVDPDTGIVDPFGLHRDGGAAG